MISRRMFMLATAGAATGSLPGGLVDASAAAANELCVFTKPFNSLSFDDLATGIADCGFDGIEAPIRGGGHIEPVRVPDQLPALVNALSRRKKRITILTSDINDPDDPLTETVLQTAAELKIPFYRMKYFRYDAGKPIATQLDSWRSRLRALAQMNADLGITAVYQNHAGKDYFGAALWDLDRALEGISPEHIGVAYDIRHATAEAGMSWPVTFRMIRPRIKAVYVKDFVWGKTKPTNVPLGEGRIQREFFRMLAASDYRGPISLHEEYLDHRDSALVPEHWAAIRQDLAQLRKWLNAAA